MKRLVSALFFLLLCLSTIAQKIELEGNYQGKNIYIQNPASASGTRYCIDKIAVNGKNVCFKKDFALELHLDSIGLKLGEALKIEIFHQPDCKPKVLVDNSTPKRTFFELVLIGVDSLGMLSWQTRLERDNSAFTVEQFKWNQWRKVGIVNSQKDSGKTNYSIQTVLHSGKNQFRIKKTDSLGMVHVSKMAEVESGIKPVKCKTGYVQILEFDQITTYEIYDQFGNVVLKGTAKTVDCRKLPKGAYYLNYDNQMGEFIRP